MQDEMSTHISKKFTITFNGRLKREKYLLQEVVYFPLSAKSEQNTVSLRVL